MVQIPSCQVREERDRRKDKTQKDPSPDVWEGIISGKCIRRQCELNLLVKIPSPSQEDGKCKGRRPRRKPSKPNEYNGIEKQGKTSKIKIHLSIRSPIIHLTITSNILPSAS